MLRAYPDPSGRFITPKAEKIADAMLNILNEDIPESDTALAVQSFDSSISSEDKLLAWWLLRSNERSAWKRFMEYDPEKEDANK